MFRLSAEHAEHLRHDLRIVRAERDSAYAQLDHLRIDYRLLSERHNRLKGENRELVERLLKAERLLAG